MADQKLPFDTVSVQPKDGNKVPVRLPIAVDAHSGKTTYAGAYATDPLVTLTEPGTAGLLPHKDKE